MLRNSREASSRERIGPSAVGINASGLHAKLFVVETGSQAWVYTGSANATAAAFHGANVEFMVAMAGPRRKVGGDSILGNPMEDDKDRPSLSGLLQPYQRREAPASADAVQVQIEEDLRCAQSLLARGGLRARVSPGNGEGYGIELLSDQALSLPSSVRGRCRPISLTAADALNLTPLGAGESVRFPRVSLIGLTCFFAFELEAEHEGRQAAVSFALKLPMDGMPESRDQSILYAIVSDRARFLRYLLFLLAAEEGNLGAAGGHIGDRVGNGKLIGGIGIPLLEQLVKAYSRYPERIDRIARLVEDLANSGQAENILPDGFAEVWQTFLAARVKELDHENEHTATGS